jgi:hypothetical protein
MRFYTIVSGVLLLLCVAGCNSSPDSPSVSCSQSTLSSSVTAASNICSGHPFELTDPRCQAADNNVDAALTSYCSCLGKGVAKQDVPLYHNVLALPTKNWPQLCD